MGLAAVIQVVSASDTTPTPIEYSAGFSIALTTPLPETSKRIATRSANLAPQREGLPTAPLRLRVDSNNPSVHHRVRVEFDMIFQLW